MPDEDDVLELPPAPSPYRERAIELLTEMLVLFDEGKLESFDSVAITSGGGFTYFSSGCANKAKSAGALLYLANLRLDFMDREDFEGHQC
jgi:hypothetical protein